MGMILFHDYYCGYFEYFYAGGLLSFEVNDIFVELLFFVGTDLPILATSFAQGWSIRYNVHDWILRILDVEQTNYVYFDESTPAPSHDELTCWTSWFGPVSSFSITYAWAAGFSAFSCSYAATE